ncbi:MAG: carboxypeptidase regulatory-like domain-containing protein [Terriglobia bacterium]
MGKYTHGFFVGVVIRLALLAGLVLGVAFPSPAQTFFGSILGTVTDSAGAVVPGANTTLTNEGTGEHRSVPTDSTGNYRYVNLIPGSYRLDVEKDGFKRVDRPGIVVEVQNSVRIDVSLEVGQLVQTIEVKAQTPLLQTDSAALGQVIDHPEVMPLNGRNVLNLATLVPGVIAQGQALSNPTLTNNTSWGNYQINGGLANENAGYMDGAPINVNYIDMIALVPTQDAIQEFKVQTSDLSAEWGRFSGGVINLTSKSGTNAFHGAAWEYVRNTDLNANTFFSNASSLSVPSYQQNQFGGDIGGPIRKDKTFFFGSYEGFRQREGQTIDTTVPTAANLQGDFTAAGTPTIYDPLTTCGAPANPGGATPPSCGPGVPLYTRQSFASEYGAGNIIPNGSNIAGVPSRIDPTSSILAKDIYPLPNLPGLVNNFVNNYTLGGDNDQVNARIDQTVSDKQHVFGRYTYWTIDDLPWYPLGKVPDPTQYTASDLSQQIVLGDTYSLSPTTVADFRVSWMRYDYNIQQLTMGVDLTQYGWPAALNSIPYRMAPQPCISGFGGDPCYSGIIIDRNMDYDVAASLTKIKGKHTLKFGFEFRKLDDSYTQTNDTTGNFYFDNMFTSQNPTTPSGSGYSFASYMLGNGSSGSANEDAFTGSHEWYDAFYAEDTFQATNRLTLNLGLRYDLPFGWVEKYNRVNVLQPNAVNYLAQATGLPLRGDAALVGSTEYPNEHEFTDRWDLFSPRVGFAYRIRHNTVVRGGYGIFDLPEDAVFQNAPFASPVNSYVTPWLSTINGGLTPYLPFSNPFPNGVIYPLQHNPGALQPYLEGSSLSAVLPSNSYGYMQQWNFSVEHELAPGTMLEVAYSASRGVHLPEGEEPYPLPDQYLSMGTGLLNQVTNPFYGQITSGPLSEPTVVAEQLLLPNPEYQSYGNTGSAIGDSNYQAMHVKLEKRFQSAGNILVSYTWSKWMTNTETNTSWEEGDLGLTTGGVQDYYNRRADWAPSSNDVPHNLVVSYSLNLPFGKGKKFLTGATGAANRLVSGWGVNGIYTLQSGVPLVITDATNNSYSLNNGTQRPNLVPGCTMNTTGSAPSRINEWFNVNCYTQPAPFTFGNVAREYANMRGAGINNSDFALFKNTALTERVHLQFRAEFFNLWNRVQFGEPGQSFGAPGFGVVSLQLNQPRLVQLVLRLEF